MPQNATPILQLPPGATSYELVGLTPNSQYSAMVAHLEPAPSSGYTQPAQVTFVTGGGVSTCAAPDDPIPFVVAYPNATHMACGVAAFNKEPVPGTGLVFYEAVETGVNTGVYGSFVEVNRVLVNPFTWGVYMENLPTDGKRRQFQVTASRPGVSDSAASPTVTVTPGTSLAPQDYPITVPVVAYTSQLVQQPDQLAVCVTATYAAPTDHDFDHMEYVVQQRQSNGTYTVGQVIVGGNAGSDTLITMPASADTMGARYLIQAVTVSSGAPTGTIIPGIPIAQTRTYGPTVGVTVPPVSNAPTVTMVTGAGVARAFLNFDTGTAYFKVYWNNSYGVTDPGAVPSVESPANYQGPDVVPSAGASSTTITFALGNLDYAVATFVPYNRSGVRGTPTTIKVLGSSAGSISAPTMAVATFPGTGGGNWAFPNWTVVKVSFVTTPSVGDWVALFQGTPLVAVHVVTSTDISNGFCLVTDPTAVAGSTYTYTATQLKLSNGVAAAVQGSITIRSGFTLATPGFTFSSSSGIGKNVAVTPNTNNYPPTAQADVQYSLVSSSGPWIDLGSLPVGDNYFMAVPSGYIGTIWVKATVSATSYTTSSVGTSSTSYP